MLPTIQKIFLNVLQNNNHKENKNNNKRNKQTIYKIISKSKSNLVKNNLHRIPLVFLISKKAQQKLIHLNQTLLRILIPVFR
jgi:hypothetical protein